MADDLENLAAEIAKETIAQWFATADAYGNTNWELSGVYGNVRNAHTKDLDAVASSSVDRRARHRVDQYLTGLRRTIDDAGELAPRT